MTLDSQIEAILFFKGEPLSIKRLASLTNTTVEAVTEALQTLEARLTGGISLMQKEDEVTLSTHKDASSIIESIIKEELVRDIGKAGLETLAIVLYKGPVTRREIDYIRGVNSTFILRNLLIRGLVEKVTNPTDERSYLYKPTFELLAHLGANKIDELPQYQTVIQELESWTKEKTAEAEGKETNNQETEPHGGE